MIKRFVQNLLHKDLSYQIHGAAIEVRKDFGPGHKEKLYQKAFAEELKRRKIPIEQERAIKIYSPKDGKFIGLYRPDFIVDQKIIIEIKAEKFVKHDEIKRIYDYLRNSEYELAYFINFASPKLFVRRIIYTNDRKYFLKKLLVSIGLILVLFSGLLLPTATQAAILYFDPSTSEHKIGDTFIEGVRINLEPNENINLVNAFIKFPSDILQCLDISYGNSLLTIVPQTPIVNNQDGLINFSGGIPNGYSGHIPGDSDLSNLLAKIIFKAKPDASVGGTIEFLNNSQVLLNDGHGTPTSVSYQSATINIMNTPQPAGKNQWQQELLNDKIPPEPFKIQLQKQSDLFNNKYFIVFSTIDKQTGIDHYEIQENRKQKIENRNWKRGESPYVLEDQGLRSYIYVKAIDKAGNERIETIPPTKKLFSWWIIILIIIAGTIIWRFIRKSKSN